MTRQSLKWAKFAQLRDQIRHKMDSIRENLKENQSFSMTSDIDQAQLRLQSLKVSLSLFQFLKILKNIFQSSFEQFASIRREISHLFELSKAFSPLNFAGHCNSLRVECEGGESEFEVENIII